MHQAVSEEDDIPRLHQIGAGGLGQGQVGLAHGHGRRAFERDVGDARQRKRGRRRVGDDRPVLHIEAVGDHDWNVHGECGGIGGQHGGLQGEHARARVPDRPGDAARERVVDRRAEAEFDRQRVGDGHIAERAAEIRRLEAVDQVLAHARDPAGVGGRGQFFVVAHGLRKRMTRRRETVLVIGIVLPVDGADHAAGQRVGEGRLPERIGEGAGRHDRRVAAITDHFSIGIQRAAVLRGLRGERHFDFIIDRIEDHAREPHQQVRVPLLLEIHRRRARGHDVARHIGQVSPARPQPHAHVDAVGGGGFRIVEHTEGESYRFAVGHDLAVGLQVDIQVRDAREGRNRRADAAGPGAEIGVGRPVARGQRRGIALLGILEVEVRRIGQAIERAAGAGQRPDHPETAPLAEFKVGEPVADVVLGVGRPAGGVRRKVHDRHRADRRAGVGHDQAGRREFAAGRRPGEDVAGRRVLGIDDVRLRRSAAVGDGDGFSAAAGCQRQRIDRRRLLQDGDGDHRNAGRIGQAGVGRGTAVVQPGGVDHGQRAAGHPAGDRDRDIALAQRKRSDAVAGAGEQRGVAPGQDLACDRIRRHRSPHEGDLGRECIGQNQERHVGCRTRRMADRQGVGHQLVQIGNGRGGGFEHLEFGDGRGQDGNHLAVADDIAAQIGVAPFGNKPVVGGRHAATHLHVVENRHLVVGLHGRQERDLRRGPGQGVARQAGARRVGDAVGRAAVEADLRTAAHIGHAQRHGLIGLHVVVHRQSAVAHAVFHRIHAAERILGRERRPRDQRAGDGNEFSLVVGRDVATGAAAAVRGTHPDRFRAAAVLEAVGYPELEFLARHQIVELSVAVEILQRPERRQQVGEGPHDIGRRHRGRRDFRRTERDVGRQVHLHPQVVGGDAAGVEQVDLVHDLGADQELEFRLHGTQEARLDERGRTVGLRGFRPRRRNHDIVPAAVVVAERGAGQAVRVRFAARPQPIGDRHARIRAEIAQIPDQPVAGNHRVEARQGRAAGVHQVAEDRRAGDIGVAGSQVAVRVQVQHHLHVVGRKQVGHPGHAARTGIHDQVDAPRR